MMYKCPSCLSHDPMVRGKDRLMRQHAREVRKRSYTCQCGYRMEEVSRRYADSGEPFVVQSVKEKI